MNDATRKLLKGLTKKQTNGTRLCDGKMANENPALILGLLDISQDYVNYLRGMTMFDGINIILGLDLYNKDKQRKMSQEHKRISSQNYKKETGRIVTVDFFGHFGTELAYEHPAIVLGAEGSSVLVAPLSSTTYGHGRLTHVDIDANSGIVSLNSAIMLEKIRYISKNRITAKHKRLTSLTATQTNPNYGKEKLREIDLKLVELLVPFEHKRFIDAEAQLITFEALKMNHQQIQEDFISAQEQIKSKDKIIEDLVKDLERISIGNNLDT